MFSIPDNVITYVTNLITIKSYHKDTNFYYWNTKIWNFGAIELIRTSERTKQTLKVLFQ